MTNALAYFAIVEHYQGEVVYYIDPWLTGELDYLYVILKIGLDFMLEIFYDHGRLMQYFLQL